MVILYAVGLVGELLPLSPLSTECVRCLLWLEVATSPLPIPDVEAAPSSGESFGDAGGVNSFISSSAAQFTCSV